MRMESTKRWLENLMIAVISLCISRLRVDRCKQAECERYKEEIASLKMEISLLQRRQSATGSIANSTNAEAAASVGTPSNVATWGTPDTKTTEDKSPSERTEERQHSNDQMQNNLDSSGKDGEQP